MTCLDLQPRPEVVAAILRQDFFSFLWKAFATLHSGQDNSFVPAWHVKAMCHELENLHAGENRRLVINVPPRHLKSITVAVAFVAYVLGRRPETKIIVASYGLDLARKHSQDCRRIMETAWYTRLFPQTRLLGHGTADEFKTTRGGGRKAVSLGSGVTGHGADYIIIDDLIKAQDARSGTEMESAQLYIEDTLLSRFDKPAEGRVVMIAQRLHEMDPPGYLLDKGNYRHLNLPAIAVEAERIAIGPGKFHTREPGEALFPERMDIKVLEERKRELGAATFNCQYQQNPVAPDASPLQWHQFGTYDTPLERRDCQLIVQSWDTGTSSDPHSDYSVCTIWGFRDRAFYLLDVYRAQLDFPDLKDKALELFDKWEPDKVLIEEAQTGRPLLQEFGRAGYKYKAKVQAITPDVGKELRLSTACCRVADGEVFLPREAAWLPAFKRELQGFPRGRNDDQVDSFSQFLNWTLGPRFYGTLGRDHPINVDRRREGEKQRRRRP